MQGMRSNVCLAHTLISAQTLIEGCTLRAQRL